MTGALARFWDKVTVTDDGCWLFGSSLNYKGYGRFWFQGRSWSVHRWAYLMFRGEIPEGFTIDHLCRNRACVNPEHLEAVTMTENTLRGHGPTATNARKTHCAAGHLLDGENLRWEGRSRRCRMCAAEAVRRFKARQT